MTGLMQRLGSLCTGYGGLDLAAEAVLGPMEHLWYAEHDPDAKTQHASAVCAAHWPDVPNLGDLTTVDWAAVPPVDVLTAGFPCFPGGTLILTRTGYQPIENVQVGDEVLTHLGRWRKVTSTMRRDGAELWRVKAGAPITTTAEHPFYARSQGRTWNKTRRAYDRTFSTPDWIDASSLKPWNHRIGHVLPPVEQPAEPDAAWWWIVGRYLADGYRQQRRFTGAGNPVVGDQGKIVIACGVGKEEELRKRLHLAGLHATEAPAGSVIKFHITNQRLYRFLAPFGRGAAYKTLPLSALTLPMDLADALLSGWLAGDGYKAGRTYVGDTISKSLAMGMVLVAHRARGVLASLSYRVPDVTTVIEGRTVNQQPAWRVAIPPNNRRGLVDGDYAWRFVTAVERPGEKGLVFNLSVEDDESYVADNAIVHNCTDVSCAGQRSGLKPGTRTGIWSHIAYGIGVLKPRLVLLENVEGLLSGRSHSDVEPCPWCLGDTPPDLVVRALGAVLADLADLGFDAEWTTVAASDVGAPHRRKRVFIVAWPASDPPGFGYGNAGPSGVGGVQTAAVAGGVGANRLTLLPTPTARDNKGHNQRKDATCLAGALFPTPTAADGKRTHPSTRAREDRSATTLGEQALLLPTPRVAASRTGRSAILGSASSPSLEQALELVRGEVPRELQSMDEAPPSWRLLPTPRAANFGREEDAETWVKRNAELAETRDKGASGMPLGVAVQLIQETPDADRWGAYALAIARWERVLGRRAPDATEPGTKGQPRLNPRFVEWLMGLPDGWVTDHLARNAALKCLGNGVVWQQAAYAYADLLSPLIAAEVAA